jgi:hypothetical protein
MNNDELQSKLNKTVEYLVTVTQFLAETSSSLYAVRRALEEVSPERFEPIYEKYFSGADCQQIRQGLNQVIQSLRDL